ncbi:LPS O-antigen chain length determinant protein WzzB [Aeromonas veronii]|uniref:LPS O-antigen chain length determinant protein WzzB n=1 Tax=Aeromonas veronii TaxID=654 RepID=UPI00111668FC|nr:Wzz/FepE/Etk N-terminal domain-containing protein [Aeromonas veronii]TNJ05624.1 hypothetical protein CF115_14970 [Aeromonas veronii]
MPNIEKRFQLTHNSPLQNDEIDLLSVISVLWHGRLVIIFCIILFGMFGIIYSLLAQERFTANAVIDYPQPLDTLGLVSLRTKLDMLGLNGVPSDKTLYEAFIVQYRTYENFKIFMEQSNYGLKLLGPNLDELSKDRLLRQLFTRVTADVANIKKQATNDGIMLSFSGQSQKGTFELLKGYIQHVVTLQQHQLLNLLSKNRILRQEALSLALSRGREDAQRRLVNEISSIKRGIAVAKSAGINEPLENINDDVRFPVTLGYEALSTKLALMRTMPIEQYDSSLSDLKVQLSRLKEVTLSMEDVGFRPFSYLDGPSIPISRDKPKRALVISLSIMLGTMMGALIVLVKEAILQRQM